MIESTFPCLLKYYCHVYKNFYTFDDVIADDLI